MSEEGFMQILIAAMCCCLLCNGRGHVLWSSKSCFLLRLPLASAGPELMQQCDEDLGFILVSENARREDEASAVKM